MQTYIYSDGDRALSGAETVTAHPHTYAHTYITAAGNFTETHILTYLEGRACRLSPTTVCPSTFSVLKIGSRPVRGRKLKPKQ